MPTRITVFPLTGTLAVGAGRTGEQRPQDATSQSVIHPVVLSDDTNMILVDTGLPGMAPAIMAAMEAAGLSPSGLTHILITHADMDHLGSLAALATVAPRKIEVLCHELEKPYIECDVPPLRLTQMEGSLHMLTGERLAQMTALVNSLKANYKNLRAKVTKTVEDRDALPCGAEVVYTPGHTPGHVCLYHRESRTLVAGDMLTVEGGQLLPSPAQLAFDREAVKQSLAKLVGYDIERVICYHGGEYGENVNQRIQEMAQM